MGNPNDILINIIARDQYNAEMKKASAAVDKMTEAEKKSALAAKEHAAQMQKLGNIAKGAALAGIGALTAAIGDSINETMEYNKSIRDLAQNLAITTEETSRIVQTADDFTVSTENVTAALEMAVKKGFSPSIDTLAKLADEYNALSSPTERAARMTEVFGRNWSALTPMLKEGGQAIRDAAAAQDDALIVTEANSNATRELEKNIDNLGDKVTAIKLKIGNALIPVLNDAAYAFEKLTEGAGSVDETENRLAQVVARNVFMFGEQSIITKQSADALRDYLRARNEVTAAEQIAAQNFKKYTGLLMVQTAVEDALAAKEAHRASVLKSVGDATQFAKDAMQGMTDAQARQAESIALFNERTAAAQVALENYRSGVNETIGRIDSLAQSLVGLSTKQATQQLAQSSLEAIQKAQEAGTITSSEAIAASNTIMLQYGLATEKTLAMASAQEAVTAAFIAGDLPLRSFVDSSKLLPDIAKDGKVSWEELNNLGLKPVSTSIQDLNTYSQTLKNAGITPLTGEIKILQDTTVAASDTMKTKVKEATDVIVSEWQRVPSDVTTTYHVVQVGTIPTTTGAPVSNRPANSPAVPHPGTTSNRTTSNRTTNNFNTTVNAGRGMNVDELANAVSQRIARQLRSARAV